MGCCRIVYPIKTRVDGRRNHNGGKIRVPTSMYRNFKIMFFCAPAHIQKGVKQRHGCRCSHFDRVAQDALNSYFALFGIPVEVFMKTIWKLQDAKSQFSKVVEDALRNGPQYVTRRGTEAVVVMSVKKYESLVSNKPGFKEFLLNCPKIDKGLRIKRQKDLPRSIDL